MSILGTRIRNARALQDARAEPMTPTAEPSPADPPYRLLWFTGIAAFMLCIVAFVLWGINGPGTLFDMIAALCS